MQEAPAPRDTKQQLLLAAAELFAEKGFDGASVREIVGKAGATLSAINYHFGSKERIYIEAVRLVLEESYLYQEILEEFGESGFSSDQEVADALLRLIRRLYFSVLGPEHPAWRGKLIFRAVAESSPDATMLYDEVFSPIDKKLETILAQFAKQSTEQERWFWIKTIFAQMLYFTSARQSVLQANDLEDYDEAFLTSAADFLGRMLIRWLGLPDPSL